ncbi:glycosyltransferase [Photobacterium kishitanii]|uniref:glycosyltransferase n=1 Tax=Photobacterium kishitanii TaxID=318456 RepID=UPI000AE3820C|nr:glycosyltransferase [Photobacterium kishitanii]
MTNFKLRAPSKYDQILCDRNLKLIHSATTEFENAEVLIAIAHKNQVQCLHRALTSALNQTLINMNIARIVVLDDSSDIIWPEKIKKLLRHPSVTLLKAECGSPARTRNLLLDWADTQSNLQWVARLDADDELFSTDSLEALWKSAKKTNSKAAIGSNNYVKMVKYFQKIILQILTN